MFKKIYLLFPFFLQTLLYSQVSQIHFKTIKMDVIKEHLWQLYGYKMHLGLLEEMESGNILSFKDSNFLIPKKLDSFWFVPHEIKYFDKNKKDDTLMFKIDASSAEILEVNQKFTRLRLSPWQDRQTFCYIKTKDLEKYENQFFLYTMFKNDRKSFLLGHDSFHRFTQSLIDSIVVKIAKSDTNNFNYREVHDSFYYVLSFLGPVGIDYQYIKKFKGKRSKVFVKEIALVGKTEVGDNLSKSIKIKDLKKYLTKNEIKLLLYLFYLDI